MDNQIITNEDITNTAAKYNAVKHNVLRATLLEHEIDEAQLLFEQLIDELKPEGKVEERLIEKVVIAQIRYQRALQAEKQQFDYITNPPVFKEEYEEGAFIPPTSVANQLLNPKKHIVQVGGSAKPLINVEEMERMEKTFVRYINTCERQFYRALHELQRVQAIRKGLRPASIAIDFIGENKIED